MNEIDIIRSKIYEIRGVKVMLDKDLAELYQVTTGNLNKSVKRNLKRFPADFMFQLTREEFEMLKQDLIFQNGISSWGGTRKLPYAFTEQGLAMLSGILNSDIAIATNISIMRAFVVIRQSLPNVASRKELEDLKDRVKALEELSANTQTIIDDTRKEVGQVYQALTQLVEKERKPLPEIGYTAIQKRREKNTNL